jgi:hypothetical protein
MAPLERRVAERELMRDIAATGSTGPSLKPVLFAIIASFVLGASVVGYLAWKGLLARDAMSVQARAAALPTPSFASPSPVPSASETARAVAAAARVAEQQGGIDQRLAAAEQRISRLDLQSQAAAGNAARAEGLLIAFATRRAIDRGDQLGYLADQLRLRFGDAQPNSVKSVIDFAADPVTLDTLLARLDGLGARLSATSSQPTLARLRSELASLFVIRRETTPSPQPLRRLDRARMFVQSGRVDRAIEEVRQLPGAAAATSWIADAERYDRAQRALDLIEASAVQEPRLLRDGGGKPVQQLSPVEGQIVPSTP